MFFPLVNRAILSQEISQTNRSNEEIKTWVEVGEIECLYHPAAGDQITSPRDEYSEAGALYVDPLTDIKVNQRITNITDNFGNVVEAGPFHVKAVKAMYTLGGRVHHKTVKLRGKTS